ncbi:hypothetical protein [Methylocapsa sp. S129]|uniref:hypothetical protein n=1 Tax=Methylocapsa sp. S129 TaxID=1641869 RepID=UPI00131D3BC0|nr:hypothetical protein [Methylocapsa sp. S129]
MTPETIDGYPFDHAGLGETSLRMALRPEGVDLARLSDEKWHARSARHATADLGGQGRDRILARLHAALKSP